MYFFQLLKILPPFPSFDAHVNEVLVEFTLSALLEIETSFTDVPVLEYLLPKATYGQLRDTLNLKKFKGLQVTLILIYQYESNNTLLI